MKIIIKDDDGKFLGDILITQTDVTNQGELANYTVLAYVDRGGEVFGLARRRIVGFPLKALNPLALVAAALRSLPKETFGAEDDDGTTGSSGHTQTPVPTDVERRLNRPLPALQAWIGGLRDHGPTVRSEQSEQHGDIGSGQGERA